MYKAVIIDDDLTTINGLTRMIDWTFFGIELVGFAQDGEEGLTIIERHCPDIILTDIYMPIMNGIEMLERIRRQGNDAEVVILSGYEDFKYAKSAVRLRVNDYLSKPATLDDVENVLKETTEKVKRKRRLEREEKELQELLAANLGMTKMMLFKTLLIHGSAKSAELRKISDYLRIELDNQLFCVMLVDLYRSGALPDCEPGEWAAFEREVDGIVDEMGRKIRGLHAADIQHNRVTLVLAMPHSVGKRWVEFHAGDIAGQFMAGIRRRLRLEAWAAIGSAGRGPDGVKSSYRQALDLLAARDSLPNKRLIVPGDLAALPAAAPHRPVEAYHAVAEALALGQRAPIERSIRQLLDMLGAMPNLTIAALRDFAIDLMGIVVTALYNQGLRMEDIHPRVNVYKELEAICSLDDLRAWLQRMLYPAGERIVAKSEQKHHKIIDYIIRYVNEHYAEDITLDVIADKVYLTRNYLSQIFKKETGENYNSYVTRVRMEKAKELMLDGHYKLYEISQMVGYRNSAYFSQIFKKYTGCNPSEFN